MLFRSDHFISKIKGLLSTTFNNIGIKSTFVLQFFSEFADGHPLVCMIRVDDVSEKIILFHNEAFPEGRNCMIWPKDGHKILLIEQHFRLWSCRASQLKNKSERKKQTKLSI